ncbi:ISNCY family transposase [Legionella sainthelensi]|uniref:ISNCY family transposase n=1 Tax=Legionella sainthelensi TaxID=28087 RepID=UPI000E1FDC12|nr:ISNCY family transposase [Legionella sainthelensi]
MIIMDSKTQLTVDIITKVSEGKITINNAAKLLACSRRTIERYLNRYQKLGIMFAIHGNTGKTPVNKTHADLKLKVQSLIKEKYYDVNLQHLAELLALNEGISVKRETLRTWAHDIHHVKRAKRRRSQIRKKRERMESSGLLLQMDGSTHQWFGDKKSCLIAIIDDATSEIHAEFFKSETTQGCLKVMRDYIEKKGVFKALYVDRAGIFGGPKRCNFSQMQRACEELGIEIIFANSAQGKGCIERSFDTLQDRLIPELRLQNINDMQNANRYLQEIFISGFWQKNLIVNAKNRLPEFALVPDHLDLDNICVEKEYRKIRNDHTFSYGNKFYLIESPLRHSIARQEIEIRKQANESFIACFAGRKLVISQVIEPTKPSLYDLEIQKKIDAIELAEKLGNVSEAARLSGCSRETIYKNRRLLKEKEPLALKRTFQPDIHHKNRTAKDVEEAVINFSLVNPHLGQSQVSAQLKLNYEIEISSAGVRNIWLRENMNTCALRVLKAKSSLEVA